MFNIDGFNERSNYIHNSNDLRNIKNHKAYDNSFAQMKIRENSPDIKTTEKEVTNYFQSPSGDKENFVIRNYNINHINQNSKPINNNNRFKKI